MSRAKLCHKWNSGGYNEERGGEYQALCNNDFNGTRVGAPFELKRPSFKAGVSYIQHQDAQNIDNVNRRNGLGNYELKRPSFKAPNIKPRQVVDFDKLQALDIEQAGQKVQK